MLVAFATSKLIFIRELLNACLGSIFYCIPTKQTIPHSVEAPFPRSLTSALLLLPPYGHPGLDLQPPLQGPILSLSGIACALNGVAQLRGSKVKGQRQTNPCPSPASRSQHNSPADVSEEPESTMPNSSLHVC